MRRNPWLIALWAQTAVGVAGIVAAAIALDSALAGRLDEQSFARVDWAWVNTLEVAVLPGCAALAAAGALALLAYGAVRRRAGEALRPSEP